jgi:hypothetical protein
MQIEYNLGKDAAILAQHGLSLAFGARLFEDGNHLVVPSFRLEDNEERWKVIGRVDGRSYSAVFVWRGAVIRFISVRRSNAGEERAYHGAASRPE